VRKTFFERLRLLLAVKLDPSSGTGVLSAEDQSALGSLYGVLCGDPTAESARYLSGLSERTQTEPGLLKWFRTGVTCLKQVSLRHYGRPFDALTLAEQDRVLGRLLSGHQSFMGEPLWRRQAKVTRWHFDQLLCTPQVRVFRQVVVADMLLDYYRGAKGWSLVGYQEYPGRVRIEWEPCEVVRVHWEEDHILLELSDSTFDRLAADALTSHEDGTMIAATKSGRQHARFSRAAYETLIERLEESGDAFVIRYATQTWRIAASA
jgi:hypothetical protein